MNFSLVQIDPVAIAVGLAIWAVVIGAIWWFPREDPNLHREADFSVWKILNHKPNASFGEFLASEQAPRTYLSRGVLSVVVTALALLVLLSSFN